MISLRVVMLCELADSATKRLLAEEDHPADALDGEEIHGCNHFPVRFEELAPRNPLATFRRGVDSMPFEDVGDGGSRYTMTQVGERSFDSRVAPPPFSLAKRTIKSATSRTVGGRPGRRRLAL